MQLDLGVSGCDSSCGERGESTRHTCTWEIREGPISKIDFVFKAYKGFIIPLPLTRCQHETYIDLDTSTAFCFGNFSILIVIVILFTNISVVTINVIIY